MRGSRFFKSLIICICILVFSSTAAFAETDNDYDKTAVLQVQQSDNYEITQKQQEVDKYVFETNAKEIADKGFTVTHTAPMDSHVEIGITPYSEENADYLYKEFGKDNVKVIKGEMATTLEYSANGEEAQLYATTGISDTASNKAGIGSTMIIVIACSLSMIIAFVTTIFLNRRQRFAKR